MTNDSTRTQYHLKLAADAEVNNPTWTTVGIFDDPRTAGREFYRADRSRLPTVHAVSGESDITIGFTGASGRWAHRNIVCSVGAGVQIGEFERAYFCALERDVGERLAQMISTHSLAYDSRLHQDVEELSKYSCEGGIERRFLVIGSWIQAGQYDALSAEDRDAFARGWAVNDVFKLSQASPPSYWDYGDAAAGSIANNVSICAPYGDAIRSSRKLRELLRDLTGFHLEPISSPKSVTVDLTEDDAVGAAPDSEIPADELDEFSRRATENARQRRGAQLLKAIDIMQKVAEAKHVARAAKEFLLLRLPPEVANRIEYVAAARITARLDQEVGRKGVQSFTDLAREEFGVLLPEDWSGEVQIVGVAQRDGHTVDADTAGVEPQAFHLYARKSNARYGESAFAFAAATSARTQAETLCESLRLVDALGTLSFHKGGAKLLRLYEEALRRNPASSGAHIEEAKARRKKAEFDAAVLDEDIQPFTVLSSGSRGIARGLSSLLTPKAADTIDGAATALNSPEAVSVNALEWWTTQRKVLQEFGLNAGDTEEILRQLGPKPSNEQTWWFQDGRSCPPPSNARSISGDPQGSSRKNTEMQAERGSNGREQKTSPMNHGTGERSIARRHLMQPRR